jgi:hypothetical protein
VIVIRLKSVKKMCPFPMGLMSHISVALMAQYLNFRQRKLGTIIIQTVYILQHDNADTGSLPVEDFLKVPKCEILMSWILMIFLS